jgi:phosphoribosyl-AMP cyclohydrolase
VKVLSDAGRGAASDRLVAHWTARLSKEVPGTVAVVLKGSHARGDAGPHSDIDFDVLVEGPPVERYPLWLEPDAGGRLRHVSVAVQDLAGWLAEGDEPEPWALGLPVREPTRLLWATTPALRERLDRPWREYAAAEPEVEDWFECFGKMRNAKRRGDALGLRQAAQELGRYTPTLLRPLNPVVFATSPRSALDLALAFPVAPAGYREDLLACLGLSEGATADDLLAAGARLVTGTMALLREHIDVVAPLLAADIAGYLRDGTLDRYIEGMTTGR